MTETQYRGAAIAMYLAWLIPVVVTIKVMEGNAHG